ncbi:uncharacterized protein LOC117123802 [Anneissia japonica]|uniref:uncharacterized protein LOC117123802 n=1 Tax=Anneissia japonica TaxID=1529436 RepID=UPI0014259100|nr:uncharacterized protein LOC117123802 [Anneissia japonica]XP_033125722.1 uncharacterized protein LOC117123802 [Anneissia japonica]
MNSESDENERLRSELSKVKKELETCKRQLRGVQEELEQLRIECGKIVCPDCQNPYDEHRRIPKRLPCNIHTCCLDCADKGADRSIVRCALCMKDYYLLIENLETNTALMDLRYKPVHDPIEQTSSVQTLGHDSFVAFQVSSEDEHVLTDEANHPACINHQPQSADKICIKCLQALCSVCAKVHSTCGPSIQDVQQGMEACKERRLDYSMKIGAAIKAVRSIQNSFQRAVKELPSQDERVSKNMKDFYATCRELLNQREKQMEEGHKNAILSTKMRLLKGIESTDQLIQDMVSEKREINNLPIDRFPNRILNFLKNSKIPELIAEAKDLHSCTVTSVIPMWRRRGSMVMEDERYECGNRSMRKIMQSAKEARDHCSKFFIPKVALYKQDFKQTIMYLGQHCSSNVNPSRSTAHSQYANLLNNHCVVMVQTYDFIGNKKVTGGDLVEGWLKRPTGETRYVHVTDNFDGTYVIKFVPSMCGLYCLFVEIFSEGIKNMPLQIKIVDKGLTNDGTFFTEDFPAFHHVVSIAADTDDDCVYILEHNSKELWEIHHMHLNGTPIGHFELNQMNVGDLEEDELIILKRQFCKQGLRHYEEYIIVLCSKQKKIHTLSMDGKVIQSLPIEQTHSPHALDADSFRLYVGDYRQQSIFVFEGNGEPEQIKLEAEYLPPNGDVMKFKFDTPFLMAVSQEDDGDLFVVDHGTNTIHQMDKRGMNMRFISLHVQDLRMAPGIDVKDLGIHTVHNFKLLRDGVIVFATSSGICTMRIFNAMVESLHKFENEKNVCMGVTSNDYVVVSTPQNGVLYIHKLAFVEFPYACP